MKKLFVVSILCVFAISSVFSVFARDFRTRSGRAEDRRDVGTEMMKNSDKTVDDARGVEGRQQFRRDSGTEALKQSGKTAEDSREKPAGLKTDVMWERK